MRIGEQKRQRTAALQNLADYLRPPNLANRPGVRQSSAALPLIGLLLLNVMSAEVFAAPHPGKRETYLETFDHGPGGWYADRRYALHVWDGVAYTYSPWWVDANHAAPGAGYLHLLLWMHTDKRTYEGNQEALKILPYIGNRFIDESYSRDLRNAKITVRIRGEVDLKGAQVLLLAQAKTAKTTANLVLSGRPLKITKDWSEQSLLLKPDPKQWTCLGARHDMQAEYGCDDVATVLQDVNVDLIFVLFPLKVVPAWTNVSGADVDRLRAVKDYPVLQDELPKGVIMFDSIKIEYPD